MRDPITFEKDNHSGETDVLKVVEFSADEESTTLVFDIGPGRFTLEAKADHPNLYFFDVYAKDGFIVASGMLDASSADALDLITELHRSVDVEPYGNVFLAAAIASAQVIHNTL